jgi:hypothetical protein
MRDPHIQAAIMFGRGRFQNGVLVQPKSEFTINHADQEQVIALRNTIWPAAERMNAYAPQHSRLFKEVRKFPST